MNDTDRLFWYENQHTLHYSLELLYVVDGYELSLLRDGEHIGKTVRGDTLKECVDKAMAGWN